MLGGSTNFLSWPGCRGRNGGFGPRRARQSSILASRSIRILDRENLKRLSSKHREPFPRKVPRAVSAGGGKVGRGKTIGDGDPTRVILATVGPRPPQKSEKPLRAGYYGRKNIDSGATS